MPVSHKFQETDFGNGYTTHHSILDIIPYLPEVLFLGTFNPLTNEVDNMADFFYGRNWFWTCMFNIFEHQNIYLSTQRKYTQIPYKPSLLEIKQFCKKYKMTFSDLISKVLLNDNIEYSLNGNKALIGNKVYDLINDGDLGELNAINQVEWTTEHLKKYLTETPSIQTVYFTRQLSEPYLKQWLDLMNYDYGRVIEFKKIFTPSGQGLRGKPRVNYLIYHWLFNENENYDQLDSNWLMSHNIDRNIFDLT